MPKLSQKIRSLTNEFEFLADDIRDWKKENNESNKEILINLITQIKELTEKALNSWKISENSI